MDHSKYIVKSIAIGDGAIASKEKELSIKVNGYFASTILSEKEYEIFHSVLSRMEFKKDN